MLRLNRWQRGVLLTVSSTAPAPQVLTKPRPPRPFQNTDSEQFLYVTQALAARLTEVVFKSTGRESDGRMKGGLRIEGTEKATGVKFDMGANIIAYIEEACLAYCFGICSFIATIHYNNWAKTAGARATCEHFTAF